MAEAKDAGSGGLQEYGILGVALGFIGLVVALWAGLKLAGWVAGVPGRCRGGSVGVLWQAQGP